MKNTLQTNGKVLLWLHCFLNQKWDLKVEILKMLKQKFQWLAKNISHQHHFEIKQQMIKLKTKIYINIIHDKFCIANQICFNKNDMQDI